MFAIAKKWIAEQKHMEAEVLHKLNKIRERVKETKKKKKQRKTELITIW